MHFKETVNSFLKIQKIVFFNKIGLGEKTMIFTPFVIFGHTWELDVQNRCIQALMDRNLFHKRFVRADGKTTYSQSPFSNNDCIPIMISVHNLKRKQLKLTYPTDTSSYSQNKGLNTEIILCEPLTEKEHDLLHKYRMLCYQHEARYQQIEMSKPQVVRDLEIRERESTNSYIVHVDGVNESNLTSRLFMWMINNL
jgi:hypothetical protein